MTQSTVIKRVNCSSTLLFGQQYTLLLIYVDSVISSLMRSHVYFHFT